MEKSIYPNNPPETLLQFLMRDFESAWDAIASSPTASGRGNFAFGLMCMIMLELGCRICHKKTESDDSSKLKLWSEKLRKKSSGAYFRRIPRFEKGSSGFGYSHCADGFALPNDKEVEFLNSSNEEITFLSFLFNTMRNGQAHQYQQILVKLKKAKDADTVDSYWGIGLTGAEHGLQLSQSRRFGQPSDHLCVVEEGAGKNVFVKVRTDVLYLDLKESILEAELLKDSANGFEHLDRSLSLTGNELLIKLKASGFVVR